MSLLILVVDDEPDVEVLSVSSFGATSAVAGSRWSLRNPRQLHSSATCVGQLFFSGRTGVCPPHRDNMPWLMVRFPQESAAVTGAPTVKRSTAPLAPLTSRASEIAADFLSRLLGRVGSVAYAPQIRALLCGG
jgi:hypothetical protein